MATDLANAAAAVAAGYKEIAIDRGASFPAAERFYYYDWRGEKHYLCVVRYPGSFQCI